MKPRLKLHIDREIEALVPGEHGLTERSVRGLMRQSSGSVKRYCTCFGFDYEAVTTALRPFSAHTAGKAARMRVVLGLPVRSSRLAMAIVRAKAVAAGEAINVDRISAYLTEKSA